MSIQDNEWEVKSQTPELNLQPSTDNANGGTYEDDVDTTTTTELHNGENSQEDVRKEALRVVAKFNNEQLPEVIKAVADAEIDRMDAQRQRTEDVRANRRNRNRSLTLVVALLFTFLVPWFIANIVGNPALLKYATGIAIFPDAIITLYAWVRHY